MHTVISCEDKLGWERELEYITKKDIFYLQAYSDLYKTIGDGDPFLFIYEDEKGRKIFYTFIRRPIKSLPFMNDSTSKDDLYDIISPTYGYGGPLYNNGDEELIKQFRREFGEYCKKENIISEFVRFHPVLKNHQHLNEDMAVLYDRKTVYVDLSKSEEEIFKQYHTNHKRNIKKSLKYKLQFKVFAKEEAIQQIHVFYELYKETMDKVNASPNSYFSTNYLESLLSGLFENAIIGAVVYEDRIISAALCMYEGGVLHYHLGCSKKEYLHLGANVFLFHNISLWGKQKGFRTFHLGGGHVEKDSLFTFKHRFNLEGALNFYIGQKIHNKDIYQFLVEKWKRYHLEEKPANFFPSYRA